MVKNSLSFFKKLSPLKQGVATLVLLALIAIACIISGQKSVLAWSFLLIPISFFCVYNPILSILQAKVIMYEVISFLLFFGIMAVFYFIGNHVSTISFSQSTEVRAMTGVAFIFFFVFHGACQIFRGVLSLLNEIDQ
jgi:hypothetical protein